MTPLETVLALGPQRLYLLTILIIFGQPVLQARLESVTGWSPNTVAKHLDALRELRFATGEARRGWVATTSARQLVLGESCEPSMTEGQLSDRPSVTEGLGSDKPANPQRLRVQPSTVEGSGHLDSSGSRGDDEEENGDQLPLEEGEPSTSEGSGELYSPAAVLAEYSIEEPARSELAALRWVIADYIDAHCSRVLAENKPIGFAIYRMRRHWGAGRPDERYLSAGGKLRQGDKYLDYLK